MDTRTFSGIILILFFSGCLCMKPVYSEPIQETTTSLISTTSITITTSSTIFSLTTLKQTVIIKVIYVNQTLDLSTVQKKSLMNMRSKYCYTSSCGAGFDEAKRMGLDILNIKKTQFAERPSSNYKAIMFDEIQNICLPLSYNKNDSIEIVLDAGSWDAIFMDNYSDTTLENRTFNNSLILRRKY